MGDAIFHSGTGQPGAEAHLASFSINLAFLRQSASVAPLSLLPRSRSSGALEPSGPIRELPWYVISSKPSLQKSSAMKSDME